MYCATLVPAVTRTVLDGRVGTLTQTEVGIVPCCVRRMVARSLGAVRGVVVEEVRVLQPAARFDLAALVERRLYRVAFRVESSPQPTAPLRGPPAPAATESDSPGHRHSVDLSVVRADTVPSALGRAVGSDSD